VATRDAMLVFVLIALLAASVQAVVRAPSDWCATTRCMTTGAWCRMRCGAGAG
jgi:hypothetical protein